MKKIVLFAFFVSLSLNCAGSSVGDGDKPPTPVTPPVVDLPFDPDPTVTVDANADGSLTADGKTADTYTLLKRRGYNIEAPDLSGSHADAPFQHIKQVMDNELKKNVFEFYIHIDGDDDRGKPEITDRQRNEIKTDAKSPANMVASQGQTHIYGWKFRLPEGFMPTKSFTHIHQLKGYGGDDIGQPIVTLTARKKTGGKEYLQVIYVNPKEAGGKAVYLKEVDLSDFVGEWVEVVEEAMYSTDGKYSLKIVRIRDGKVLVDISNMTLALWRTGATAVRPKYGIYRGFGTAAELKPEMRDEVLRFADFTLTEK